MPGSSHSELMPGDLLGKYRIERFLGHGGMATVYLAVQEGTGLEVALKVLTFRGESNRPGGDVARFIREARLAGGIRHPHWVSVYETGYDAKSNLYYIAMERMQASLAQRLRAHGPLPEPEAIAVVEQIAFALAKAFETQMVHRDIKPANILYNAAGVYKLTDFGIAKSSRNEETQLTLREAVFGTPAYMSPEQARDARMVDARSDIYSLGTVFFELLSGERPYQGETPVQVLAQVITDKPPPDVRSKPKARKIHSDTAKLVACMMAKDPAERPQTPADLIERLQKLKAHTPYAKPEESAAGPEYDDSTIMDPTNPPPTDAMLDAGFPSDPGTVRAPTGGAGHTGMWDGAPTGGGNTGGGTGGGAEPRTAVSLPTFSTQAVKDGTVGTVATVATRFGETGSYRAEVARARGGGRKSAAGKVWFAVAAVLLLLLGVSFWATATDFIPNHAGDPGLLGDICRLVYSGPAEPPDFVEPPQPPLPIVTDSVSLVVSSAGDVDEPFEVVLTDKTGEYSRTATVPAFGGTCEFTQLPESPEWSLSYPNPKERFVHRPETHLVLTSGVNRIVAGVSPKTPPTLAVRNTDSQFLNVQAGDVELKLPAGATSEPIVLQTPGEVQVVYYAPYSEDKTRRTNSVTLGWETRTLDLRLKQTSSAEKTHLALHNPEKSAVFVEMAGGYAGSFWLAAGERAAREPQPGIETSIRYYANSDAYREHSPETAGSVSRTLAAGERDTVELALTPQERRDATSVLTLRNPNAAAVFVEGAGGFSGTFWLEPGSGTNRTVVPGIGTSIRFYANDDAFAESSAETAGQAFRTLAAGEKAVVDLVLTPAGKDSSAMAIFRLHNPNDVGVVFQLSGGRKDEIWVESGKTTNVWVRPRVETEARCYANDRQYAENSPETAKLFQATPKGGEAVSVDLKLTKRDYPVVQLVNGGSVELAVRVNGKSYSLSAGGKQPVEMPANRKVTLEWEAGEEGYLEGGREIGPYAWNQRVSESIVPERQTPPSIRVRNVSSRAMTVTVTRVSDGKQVEEPFRLEGGTTKTVKLPNAGTYRVQTQAIPNRREAVQDPDHYDALDREIECTWGKEVSVECTANLKRPSSNNQFAQEDFEKWGRESLVSHLKSAQMKTDEAWVEHSIDGAVSNIAESLRAASGFARYGDPDEIAGNDVPYNDWAKNVAAKRGYHNAEWQRIVEATAASGSWAEFFARFQTQDQRH